MREISNVASRHSQFLHCLEQIKEKKKSLTHFSSSFKAVLKKCNDGVFICVRHFKA